MRHPRQLPLDPKTRMPNWPVGPFIHALLLQMLTEPPWSAGCRAGGKATVAKDAPLSQSSRSEGGGWRSRENQTSRRNCVRKKINGMGEATLDRKGYAGLSFEDDRGTGTRGNKGECPTAGKQFSRWVQETQRAGRLERGRRGCGGWQWPRSERPRQEVCISLF